MTVPIRRYGDTSPARLAHDLTLDELRRSGFAIVRGVLDDVQLDRCRVAIDRQRVLQGESPDADRLASSSHWPCRPEFMIWSKA